jgi:hypothetical protein
MSKYQIDQEGTYKGIVVEPMYEWLGEGKGGSRYVCVPVQITEGSEKGKTINWYGNLGNDVGRDGKTKTERTVETLENAFGINWDWNNINWAGASVEVVVSEYNGKLRAQYLNPPDKPRLTSTDNEAKKAEALEKSKEIANELLVSSPRRKSNAKPAIKTTPSVKTHDDEGVEIPF